ncbi:MAG: helix-turn-helix transcriptional regulator [Acidobacteria bacterium]|nr:helix-turn-helix transcriptional regulator [Acidobacteriota bacterium]
MSVRNVTRQQTRIAELVARGKSNKEIAAVLGCSPRTVGNTLALLYARPGIRRRSELAVLMVARDVTGGRRIARKTEGERD